MVEGYLARLRKKKRKCDTGNNLVSFGRWTGWLRSFLLLNISDRYTTSMAVHLYCENTEVYTSMSKGSVTERNTLKIFAYERNFRNIYVYTHMHIFVYIYIYMYHWMPLLCQKQMFPMYSNQPSFAILTVNLRYI